MKYYNSTDTCDRIKEDATTWKIIGRTSITIYKNPSRRIGVVKKVNEIWTDIRGERNS